jgi:succinyl-CoA synthetase beta subunit
LLQVRMRQKMKLSKSLNGLNGLAVENLLVEEKLKIEQELYLALTVDGTALSDSPCIA